MRETPFIAETAGSDQDVRALNRRDLLIGGAAAISGALVVGIPSVAEAAAGDALSVTETQYSAVGFLPSAGTGKASATRKVLAAERVRSAAQKFGGVATIDFHGISGTVLQPVRLTARFPMGEPRLRRYRPYYVTAVGLEPTRGSQPSTFTMPFDVTGGLTFSATVGEGDEQVTVPFRVSPERGAPQLDEGIYFVMIGNPRRISNLNWQSYQVGPEGPEAGLVRTVMHNGRRQFAPVEFIQFTFSLRADAQ